MENLKSLPDITWPNEKTYFKARYSYLDATIEGTGKKLFGASLNVIRGQKKDHVILPICYENKSEVTQRIKEIIKQLKAGTYTNFIKI